ncbi:MAG TPA: tyrosine-type recombinase/integrase [Acidimicrobiales bacterium]
MKGHLRQRGNAWELRAYVGVDPLTNRKKYLTRTFRGGKRDAEEALARFTTEVAGGGHAAQNTMVGDLIQQWLNLSRAELSPTTARGYDWIIKAYITPTLGNVPLGKLRTAQLDRFYSHLREKGGQQEKPLSAATVHQVHAILRRALHQGIRWGWITENPAALASPPRVRAPHLSPPDPAAVIRLLEAADESDPDLACFLRLAATTGARRGEVCGLRWRDIDLTAGTVLISRSVVEAANNVIIEKDTKTHASRRIALDPGTISALLAQQVRMRSRAAACGGALKDAAHVFSRDPEGDRPWTPNSVTKAFIRVRTRAGQNSVRLHDLRHFAATRMLVAGVPVRTVSGRLGHSNAATTLGVYAHFVEASDRDAATTLGALLESPAPSERTRANKRPQGSSA